MGRRRLPENMMKDAIDEQDIELFCWGILEKSRLELDIPEEKKTFSTSDAMSIVRQLVVLSTRNVSEDNSGKKNNELEDWMKRNKNNRSNIKKTL